MATTSRFDCRRITNTQEYQERITKDGEPWACIIEISNNGNPYYHCRRVDGLCFDCPTVVEAKAQLFTSQT